MKSGLWKVFIILKPFGMNSFLPYMASMKSHGFLAIIRVSFFISFLILSKIFSCGSTPKEMISTSKVETGYDMASPFSIFIFFFFDYFPNKINTYHLSPANPAE